MIADAARKGERLSAAGERASRAAQRLVRRLDDELREIDGLVVRLAPVSEPAPAPPATAPAAAAPAAPADVPRPAAGGTLRLLGRPEPGDEAGPRARGEESP
jgi:hypothetical protein